ncbi:MAG: sigma-70 family RNA polymerase sigma factor [Oscillospiraceae bacterium]|nr:sigma-70 family RNA polymerase sigma factor [Oscillospiraceae bacterium]
MKGGDGVLDFEKVFTENNQFVFRFLMKLCGDVSLAEELTQETFFRAYMNISGLRNEEKVAAWLCQIAKNTYFAWFNAQKKNQPMAEELANDSTPDIAEFFEEKELAGRAFSRLHALEEPYKEVFMLFVFGGLSLKDISAMFGKSESWARVTYYRAKQKIMEGLGR